MARLTYAGVGRHGSASRRRYETRARRTAVAVAVATATAAAVFARAHVERFGGF